MSQAEELLNSVSEEVPVHTHPVPDTDTYFVIDPVTRQIENTSPKKNVIMQYDHNSERFTFELPRYIDGHDMLECTSVTVNVDNIEVAESEEVEPRVNSDAPDMTDLRVHPADPEKVICSWLISRNSTQLAGILSFHIEFKCVDSNGNVVYEWSTDTYSDITVKARKKNGEAAVAEHTDLLEQWRTRIFGAGDSVMANIAAEGEAQVIAVKAESETQQEAVELKGARTLDSIPEEYTEVDAMAEEAVRSKGDAIICEAAGESIALKDSSNDYIRGLKLFGKSTQGGTPTPDNPVDIVSIDGATITVIGKNLLNHQGTSKTMNGVTFTVNADKSIHAHGTATGAISYYLRNPLTLPKGSYIMSGCPAGGSVGTYRVYYSDNTSKTVGDYGQPAKFTLDEEFTGMVVLQIYNGAVIDNLTFYPMICEDGFKDTPYEPYVAPQTLVLPNTLPGIPIISGGNYTDSDGQQWICDEVDLERGVYVQRVKTETFDGNNSGQWWEYFSPGYEGYARTVPDMLSGVRWAGYSNMFKVHTGSSFDPGIWIGADNNVLYLHNVITLFPSLDYFKEWVSSNPFTVMYPLATPIETPLTAEEITAFKALRTNYPNTTILNDAGAWMSVKYNADTKAYVENPKTLKLVDSSTGVVYELKVVDGNLTVVPVQ